MESPIPGSKTDTETISEMQTEIDNLREKLSSACEMLSNAYDLIDSIRNMFAALSESWDSDADTVSNDIVNFLNNIE